VSVSNLIQYFVSLASLYEMVRLAKKSFLLCPPIASSIFAPIDVPERINYLLKIYSFFSA
jgi:hypothetical protein